jgi:NADH dehydrogenase FAD-containing subunit
MSDARGGAWDVVIAGGGAAGVSVAAALLACADRLLITSADPARPERTALLDRASEMIVAVEAMSDEALSSDLPSPLVLTALLGEAGHDVDGLRVHPRPS